MKKDGKDGHKDGAKAFGKRDGKMSAFGHKKMGGVAKSTESPVKKY